MNNVELLKKAYQNFAEGNIPAVLGIMDEKIEWNSATSWPFLTSNGPVIGPQNVVTEIFAQIPVHYENFNIDIQGLMASGNKVVMEGYYTGIWKETGKEFKANAVHIWDVKDGKITRYFQAVDTAEIMNAWVQTRITSIGFDHNLLEKLLGKNHPDTIFEKEWLAKLEEE